MSDYLYKKFFGKYRILAPIDSQTNDFPRNDKGDVDTEDFYIYNVSSDRLTLLESLDKIKTESNIKALQKRILPLLN